MFPWMWLQCLPLWRFGVLTCQEAENKRGAEDAMPSFVQTLTCLLASS
jgi:hypothetical protein